MLSDWEKKQLKLTNAAHMLSSEQKNCLSLILAASFSHASSLRLIPPTSTELGQDIFLFVLGITAAENLFLFRIYLPSCALMTSILM